MAKSRVLTKEDYARIESLCNITGDEDYAVVTTRQKGVIIRSVHVFARGPMTKEITEYEATASKVKFRGNKAEVEGSQVTAAKHLYNHLIARAYDVPTGRAVIGSMEYHDDGRVKSGQHLGRDEAVEKVPVLIKREAIRDMVSSHWSVGQLIDMEGDDDEMPTKGDKEED